MKVVFKLFASLTDYLPPERTGNRISLEVAEDTTVADIIAQYRIPPQNAHLVLINGVFVAPAQRATRRLAEGDELAVWPPIAGG